MSASHHSENGDEDRAAKHFGNSTASGFANSSANSKAGESGRWQASADERWSDFSVGRKRGSACRDRSGLARRRARFSPVNLIAMVVGFMVFWPIGLFILFWTLSGRNVVELAHWGQDLWQRVKGRSSGDLSEQFAEVLDRDVYSDNAAFNDYQRAELDRIRELREDLHRRTSRFERWREAARRREEEAEFQRFMAEGGPDSPSRAES